MEDQQTGQAADRGTIDTREGLKRNYVQSGAEFTRDTNYIADRIVADPEAVRAAIAGLWVDDARRGEIARRGYEYAMSLGGDDEYHRNVICRVIQLVRGDRPDEPAGPATSPAGAPSRTVAPDPGDLDRS